MYTTLKQESKGKKKVKTYQSTGEKTTAFRKALEGAIHSQMKNVPERFHKIVHRDKTYAETFSEHMIQKFGEGRVLVINDTVALALKKLGLAQDVDAVYSYLDIKPPAVKVKKLSAKELAKRKRAAQARRARKALKELGGSDEQEPNNNFRGC